jgi:hypothetical protein
MRREEEKFIVLKETIKMVALAPVGLTGQPGF